MDHDLKRRVAAERRPAGQRVVEGAAQAVQVGADIDLVDVAGLLGRDVRRRADEAAFVVDVQGVGGAFAAQPGQAEIDDLDERRGDRGAAAAESRVRIQVARRAVGDQQVGRFDVAVDHALFLGVLERAGHLVEHGARQSDGQRPLGLY